MKILLDNGHGENTPGKRSPDGKLREYLYAREIASMVYDELYIEIMMLNFLFQKLLIFHSLKDANELINLLKN